jgi:hypothetical protein
MLMYAFQVHETFWGGIRQLIDVAANRISADAATEAQALGMNSKEILGRRKTRANEELCPVTSVLFLNYGYCTDILRRQYLNCEEGSMSLLLLEVAFHDLLGQHGFATINHSTLLGFTLQSFDQVYRDELPDSTAFAGLFAIVSG